MQIINIKKHLTPNKPIIIALSGGADSVCLTHLFWKMKKYKVVLAHFNHHLRTEESDLDEAFVVNFSKKRCLPIEIGHWNNPQKSEAEARKARYAFLRIIQKKYDAQAICLGHHQDDQVETILFNFLRGTGTKGLQGMPFFENKLLRPLLNYTKKEILEYCKKENLKYVTDKTNFDLSYARNLLRLKILPELKKINPNLAKTLLQNAQNYKEVYQNLYSQTEPFLNQDRIKLKDFLALDSAVQSELVKSKIKDYTEPSYKKVEEILKIIRGGVGNKYKEFDRIRVSVGKGEVVFEELAVIPPRGNDEDG